MMYGFAARPLDRSVFRVRHKVRATVQRVNDRILHNAVLQTLSPARVWQQVRRIAHRLDAASQRCVNKARLNLVHRNNGRFHATEHFATQHEQTTPERAKIRERERVREETHTHQTPKTRTQEPATLLRPQQHQTSQNGSEQRDGSPAIEQRQANAHRHKNASPGANAIDCGRRRAARQACQ